MPKNVMCKRCNNLANQWCEKVTDSPDPDLKRDCQHFREKTNADRIRAMSDEELAAIIRCPYATYPDICRTPSTCLDCCEEWLKQPAE
jgi:hypothetical protein